MKLRREKADRDQIGACQTPSSPLLAPNPDDLARFKLGQIAQKNKCGRVAQW